MDKFFSMATDERGHTFDEHEVREMLGRILAEVASAKRPALYAECIAITLGVDLRQGLSQSQIARDHNVTRACVSKICLSIAEAHRALSKNASERQEARTAFANRKKSKRNP